MDQPDQQFPGLSRDEHREEIVPTSPPLGEKLPSAPAPGTERAASSDDLTDVVDLSPGGAAMTAETAPERPSRPEGGRVPHRAKVSWVGKSDNARQASRRGWVGRLAHVITADPVRSPGAAVPATGPSVTVAEGADKVAGAAPAGNGGAATSAAGKTDDAAPPTVTKADPRDEIVFVPARRGAESPEGEPLSSAAALLSSGTGGAEPVFPATPRRNPVTATATGVGVGLVALLCFYAGPPVVLALTSILLAVAMLECYRSLQRAGYRPAAALGLVAAPGGAVAGYFEGTNGVALVAAFIVVASFCWYLGGVTRRSPVVNLGATVMGWAWVGLLGSFTGLLLDPAAFPRRAGLALLLGAVEATVAYDVGGYLFGSWLGKRPMIPRISPKKTWEGLIGGCLAAFVISVAVVSQMSPWSYGRGALLGLVVVVLAPLGDLAESMVKRDLGLKDMGTLLPAHGGALDRIDGLLFVLPAAYLLVRLLHW